MKSQFKNVFYDVVVGISSKIPRIIKLKNIKRNDTKTTYVVPQNRINSHNGNRNISFKNHESGINIKQYRNRKKTSKSVWEWYEFRTTTLIMLLKMTKTYNFKL